MENTLLSIDTQVATFKEALRYVILSIPGSALGIFVALVAAYYFIWSSLKSGLYYSKGLGLKGSYIKGFYMSSISKSPTSISRTVYVCTLVLAFLICAIRGILGFMYQAL